MKKMNKKGFTIVELVIVIAVIGILAAVLIPTFSSVIEKANKSAAEQELKNAYTLALAEAIEDGKVTDDEVYILSDGTISLNPDPAPELYAWSFTFTAEDTAEVTRTGDTKFDYEIAEGKPVVTPVTANAGN